MNAKLTVTGDVRIGILRAEFPSLRWSPEYRFHPRRKWRFDYAAPDALIAVEIEGGVAGRGKPCPVCKRAQGGAHSSYGGIMRDIEKYNEAQSLGWRVFRFTPDQFEKKFDWVEQLIEVTLENDVEQIATD